MFNMVQQTPYQQTQVQIPAVAKPVQGQIGTTVPPTEEKKTKWWLWVLVILISLGIGVLAGYFIF